MSDTPERTDYFGFLSRPWTIHFRGGVIQPLPNFDEVLAQAESLYHVDGFRYPPRMYEARIDPVSDAHERIPQTERPALVYRPDVTHQINYLSAVNVNGERNGRTGFLIQLLGFLAGHQTQFFDWWLTGRTLVKPREPFYVQDKSVQRIVQISELTWDRLSPEHQTALTNILYCRNKMWSYEWSWEEFSFGYMVLDAIWAFHCEVTGEKKEKGVHGKRIETLCIRLSLEILSEEIGHITSMRHKLFHESLWDGATPGFGSGAKGIGATLLLRQLLNQLIVRTLGIDAAMPAWNIRGLFVLEPGNDQIKVS